MSRVLLVDDDAMQLRLNKAILEAEGFTVSAAATAHLALESCVRERPDVIVSDVRMEDVDGFGLCRRVKADPDLASIPVVLITAQSAGDRHTALATFAGASTLVERTPGFEGELAAIRRCLILGDLRQLITR